MRSQGFYWRENFPLYIYAGLAASGLLWENKVNGTALPINTEIDEIAKFLLAKNKKFWRDRKVFIVEK